MGALVYQEICFNVVVEQPDVLTVSSKLLANSTQVALKMEGSGFYNVEINGVVVQTAESELVLDLEKGPNVLKVSTGLPCQGIYEETLVVAPEPILFPNPTRNNVSIYYDHANQPLGIRVFAANGQLVREESQTGEKVQTEISLSGLPQGIYYVEISGNGFKKTQKVIKQ